MHYVVRKNTFWNGITIATDEDRQSSGQEENQHDQYSDKELEASRHFSQRSWSGSSQPTLSHKIIRDCERQLESTGVKEKMVNQCVTPNKGGSRRVLQIDNNNGCQNKRHHLDPLPPNQLRVPPALHTVW
jgi:hypothetical protein